eukprot:m.96908 g.96908  ORF g.96908 m.96908 type:complete len:669 (+) comp8977_c0_seq1:54-2060(+)
MPKTPSFFRKSKTKLSFVPRTVVLKNRKGELHFNILGGVEADLFCTIQLNGKPPMKSGKLKEGDIIVSVNDERVIGETHKYVVDLINESKGDIKLTVALPKDKNFSKVSYVYNLKHPDPILAELQNSLKRKVYDLAPPFTTRPQQKGELQGVDYNFVTGEEFNKLIESGRMLDYGERDGFLYGNVIPSEKMVERRRNNRKKETMRNAIAPSTVKKAQRKSNVKLTIDESDDEDAAWSSLPRSSSVGSNLSTLSHPRSPRIPHLTRETMNAKIQTLVLARGEDGRLGFSFDAGIQYNYLLSVREVYPTICILTTTNRELRPGDCILAINGMNITACTSEDVEEMLNHCGDPVELTTTCFADASHLNKDKRLSATTFLSSSKFDIPELHSSRAELRKVVHNATVPYTTKQPHPDDGGKYIYVSKDKFEALEKERFFVDVNTNDGILFGTPRPGKNVHIPTSPSLASQQVKNSFKFKDAIFTVERQQRNQSWGIELLKGNKYIFIHRVVEDSPAHRAFLRKGMQLLEVDGRDMRKSLIQDAIEVLQQAGTIVQMKMRYNKDGLQDARATAKDVDSPFKDQVMREEETERQQSSSLRRRKLDGTNCKADDNNRQEDDDIVKDQEKEIAPSNNMEEKIRVSNRNVVIAVAVALLILILVLAFFYLKTQGIITL